MALAIEQLPDDVATLKRLLVVPDPYLVRFVLVLDQAGEQGPTEIAGLLEAARKIDAAPVDPRRRAGFQAPLRQLQLPQPGRPTRPTGVELQHSVVVPRPEGESDTRWGDSWRVKSLGLPREGWVRWVFRVRCLYL